MMMTMMGYWSESQTVDGGREMKHEKVHKNWVGLSNYLSIQEN